MTSLYTFARLIEQFKSYLLVFHLLPETTLIRSGMLDLDLHGCNFINPRDLVRPRFSPSNVRALIYRFI